MLITIAVNNSINLINPPLSVRFLD